MKTLALLAALAFLPLAFAPTVGADAGLCAPSSGVATGTANPDGTITYTGCFTAAFPLGTLGANTKQSGIDSFFLASPGPGWFLVAHVDSTAETLAYDVDIHYYTAANVHVDSQDATTPYGDRCDVSTPQADQACFVPDFGASNDGLKVDIDAKEGANFRITVTAYPPGQCQLSGIADCKNADNTDNTGPDGIY